MTAEFSSVVCFTMLHHVPTPPLQDRLCAEAFRVLGPGGVFAGSDGVHSLGCRIVHIGDTYNPVLPEDAARPAAPCRVHRRARGHQGRRAALARV